MEPRTRSNGVRAGWGTLAARVAMVALLFEALSGLAVTFAPFHAWVEWSVLLHTLGGVLTLLPVAWYYGVHWQDYRHYAMSHIVLLGYVGLVGLIVCSLSGLVVTWQGLFATSTSAVWRQVHLISTFVGLGAALPHILLVLVRVLRAGNGEAARRYVRVSLGWTAVGLLAIVGLTVAYDGREYVNEFPDDYQFLYGEDRPFAPSLARTATGGAYDPRSLSGSESCGTSGCHEQIVEEWKPSAHRYSAMDVLFQKVQGVMAEQNGPESTRYCGGCHDPISLFAGAKNLYAEELTDREGHHEGVSCLVCHSVRETDLQGNANYVLVQPEEYLFQWSDKPAARLARDFLIRTYPAEHNRLSKRMFKTPEYCAACHKQFIDQEINRVGWVQLQNQYDNWAASHWFTEGDPTKTIECRECHMPLVASSDPASGDEGDYNRTPDDGKHRSHRFIASNLMMPEMLKLDGWERQVELTEEWLQGRTEIPEISDKWREGPIVSVALEVPDEVVAGDSIPVRVVLTSNKVGHDYPTGPLDIIQSWLEVRVTDQTGREVYTSGEVGEDQFIEPGSFMFKAEPVDQHGNLIDRHNLWEMVGVRYRRALFPGYSDVVDYAVSCPSTALREGEAVAGGAEEALSVPTGTGAGEYRVEATLRYRKVDQYLLNFLLGDESGITAPVTDIARTEATVRVRPGSARASASGSPKHRRRS